MEKVEKIKQDIRDWFEDPEQTLLVAFSSFVNLISWRRGEITLDSGVAKLHTLTDESVVFWVGEDLFCVDRDDSADFWQVDDLYEVKPVNKTVVDFEKVNSTP